jgi:hypothetical protein
MSASRLKAVILRQSANVADVPEADLAEQAVATLFGVTAICVQGSSRSHDTSKAEWLAEV